MKKYIPLHLIEALEKALIDHGDLLNIEAEAGKMRFTEKNDPASPFYFTATVDGTSYFTVTYAPASDMRVTAATHTKVEPNALKNLFNLWLDRVVKYNKPSPVFDDPILQSYYDDLGTRFTTNDADADTAPFSHKLQGLLFGVYDEIKKLVEAEKDDENVEEAERILKEIKLAQKNIGKSTKRQALKTMQKIVAMCQKYSYHVGKVILDGTIFEVAKYLATGSM